MSVKWGGRQQEIFQQMFPKIIDLRSSSEQIIPKIDVGCPWIINILFGKPIK